MMWLGQPAPPSIPSSFRASILNHRSSAPSGIKINPTPMLYSLSKRSIQTSFAMNVLGIPFAIDSYAVGDNFGSNMNGVCYMQFGMPFFDLFGWVNAPSAKYLGNFTDKNGSFDRWMITTSKATLWLDNRGDVPLSLTIYANQLAGNTTFEFLEFYPDNNIVVTIPEICNIPPAPCSSDGVAEVRLKFGYIIFFISLMEDVSIGG